MLDMKIMTFLKVAELKSYTKAAAVLHMTQPAVSQHIKKLEEYYGCKLINSSGHSVRLTEAADALYDYVQLSLANESDLNARLKKIEQPLRLGATLSIADYYLPDALIAGKFINQGHLSVTVSNTKRLIGLLLDGKIDCAFIEGIFDESLFECKPFCTAHFLPLVSKNHPLAGKIISFSDIFCYPLAIREVGSGTRELLETTLYERNSSIHSFNRVTELGSFMLIKQVVTHSDAISFVYEAVAKKEVEQGNLCFLRIDGYSCMHTLMFVYRKNSIRSVIYESFFDKISAGIGV